jgi:hypothetical protein
MPLMMGDDLERRWYPGAMTRIPGILRTANLLPAFLSVLVIVVLTNMTIALARSFGFSDETTVNLVRSIVRGSVFGACILGAGVIGWRYRKQLRHEGSARLLIIGKIISLVFLGLWLLFG